MKPFAILFLGLALSFFSFKPVASPYLFSLDELLKLANLSGPDFQSEMLRRGYYSLSAKVEDGITYEVYESNSKDAYNITCNVSRAKGELSNSTILLSLHDQAQFLKIKDQLVSTNGWTYMSEEVMQDFVIYKYRGKTHDVSVWSYTIGGIPFFNVQCSKIYK